jgi:uncharacterized integral membrane protein
MTSDPEPRRSRSWVTPSRLLWAVLALVAFILLAQNSQQVTVKFLAWDISAPLFVVIGAALLIGWGLGGAATRTWRWHTNRDRT